jgi:hypothetical protein
MDMSTSLSMKGGVPRAVADVVASRVDPAAACVTGARASSPHPGARLVDLLPNNVVARLEVLRGGKLLVQELLRRSGEYVPEVASALAPMQAKFASAHLHHCMLPPLLYDVLLRRCRPCIRRKVHLASSPSVCRSNPHPPCAARESNVHLVARLDPQQAS